MKHIAMGFILIFSLSVVQAQTPFTLTGVTKLSVLVEDYSGLHIDEKLLDKFKSMMTKMLKEVGVSVEKYNNKVLGLILKGQKVQDVQLLTLELILAGQVYREGEKESVFGLTYNMRDTIELENIEEDSIDSLEFLLSEFKDQYIEDQKE